MPGWTLYREEYCGYGGSGGGGGGGGKKGGGSEGVQPCKASYEIQPVGGRVAAKWEEQQDALRKAQRAAAAEGNGGNQLDQESSLKNSGLSPIYIAGQARAYRANVSQDRRNRHPLP